MSSDLIPFLLDTFVAKSLSKPHHSPHSHSHKSDHSHGPTAPFCYSPDAYRPKSLTREFDSTPCFEAAVVLPLPLVLLILAGLVDLWRIKSGKKGGRRERGGWSRGRSIAKMALLGLAFAAALANLIISLIHIPHGTKSIVTLPYLIWTLSIPLIAALSYYNHHHSVRSSTIILLFWPVYLVALGVALRTQFSHLHIEHDHHNRLYGRVYGKWDATGKAAFALLVSSVILGMLAWAVEIVGPEQKGIRIGEEIDYQKGKKGSTGYDSDVFSEDGHENGNGNGNGETDNLLENGQGTANKGTMEEKVAMEDVESPVLRANIYSRLTFGYLTPLMKLGARRFIEEDDMWPLPSSDSAENLNHRLITAWEKQKQYVKDGKKKKPSLKVALFRAFGSPYVIAGLMKLVYDSLSFLQPQLLRLLLIFIRSYEVTDQSGPTQPQPPIQGFTIAVLMFLAANGATFLLHQYFERAFATTMRVRSALAMLIYEKSLVISNGERSGRTTGDIVNLQSVDAARISDLCQYGLILFSAPFQITLAFLSLYKILGWQAFVGVGVMLVSLPVNTLLARRMKTLQKKMMTIKDKRTRLVNEVVANIKSIKLYGWEKTFQEKVLNVRNQEELRMLKKIGYNGSFSFLVFSSTPFLVAFASFSVYAVTSPEPLTSDKIFASIALFQLLSFPLGVFSNILSSIIEAAVSVKRIEGFLAGKELQVDAREIIRPEQSNGYSTPRRGQNVVTIQNGDFKWNEDATDLTLEGIDLNVKKGELVAVLGRVGDGKTSLLSAILGEMMRTDGKVTVAGDIAYFSQNSFILSATIRENIIFGTRFDEDFYRRTIEACALQPDLAIMDKGEFTEVGEKGVSLSGGQKARIALARCVYARADLYLLDDPLSAVDAHVGQHIWDNVLGPKGLLANKARVLCTNAVTYLPEVDNIVMLRRGVILETGSYSSTMSNTNSEIYKLVSGLGKQQASEEDNKEKDESTDIIDGDEEEESKERLDEFEQDTTKLPRVDRRMSTMTLRKASVLSTRAAKIEAVRGLKNDSKPAEHREKGKVKAQVYSEYIVAASKLGVAIFLIFIVLAQATSIGGNWILKGWARANAQGETNQTTKYLILYGSIGLISSLVSVGANLVLQVFCALKSSKYLHDKSFAALMRSPMSYFEQTPQGRILNIFTRDIYVVDEVMVRVISALCRCAGSVIGTLAVIALSQPLILIAVIPIAFIYRVVMRYYLATSRELKRLEAVSRSPIYSWFSESLAGSIVIRAYNQTERFTAANEARIDRNCCTYMPAMNVNRWLAVRLEGLGSFLILSAAVASVLSAVLGRGKVDSGLVGITLSYVVSVSGAAGWLVRSASDVESNITSVERVLGYTELKPEAPYEIQENRPDPSWPAKGNVEFVKYSTKYRPELQPVLKNVSLSIKGGEKIGICGRTGAGKSSTTLALLRIIEPTSGKILVDGVDITTLGLKDLRNAISIIPQDPQLFEATVRENIDPVGHSTDQEIWYALEQSYLKDFVQNSLGGLDGKVSEGGVNMSSGQRQLICFARALLRKTKILILDEATSSIDLQTDDDVQKILRGPAFSGVTTLTIAHRLNTIYRDSTRILVLEKGEVAEFDTPDRLLRDENSVFYALAKQAGLSAAE